MVHQAFPRAIKESNSYNLLPLFLAVRTKQTVEVITFLFRAFPGAVSGATMVNAGHFTIAESDLEALKQMVANHGHTFRLPNFALNR